MINQMLSVLIGYMKWFIGGMYLRDFHPFLIGDDDFFLTPLYDLKKWNFVAKQSCYLLVGGLFTMNP